MGGDDYVIDDNGAWGSMSEALEWYRAALKTAAAKEREACAAACESHALEPAVMVVTTIFDRPRDVAIRECAALIRCRKD